MKNSLSFSRYILIFGLPVLLILSLIFLIQSPWYNNGQMSQAITLDFVLTLPILYFILIRKTEIPKITIVTVFVLGLVMATVFLPKNDQSFLELIKFYVLPIIELVVVGFIGFKFFQLRKTMKSIDNKTMDFNELLNQASQEVFPGRVGALLASEIAVLHYSFFNWTSKSVAENEFYYHNRSGSREVLGAFTFVILVETFAIHLLIESWSTTAAWVLTFLSLYTALQVFALIRSMSKRPHLIEQDQLHLRYGFMVNTTIQFSDIESIEFSRKTPEKEGFKSISLLGEIDGHNTILHLKKEHTLTKIYGLKDKFTSIGFFVDDKEVFKNEISKSVEVEAE